MKHLTSQALDCATQMPLHLSIHAIGYCADDGFENHFITHQGIELTAARLCVYGLPDHNYSALDVFSSADIFPDTALPVLKHPFFPWHMEVTEQLRGIIRA